MFLVKRMMMAAVVLGVGGAAMGHEGRRFEIGLLPNGQLFAQGVNTIDQTGDPAGPRPYINALHDHWENIGGIAAFADLPSFDLFDPAAELVGARIDLMLMGGFKWVAPDTIGPIVETALGAGEAIDVSFGGSTISTASPGGSLTLIDSVPFGGMDELDVSYTIETVPSGALYVLEFVLKAFDSLGDPLAVVTDSDTIYVILSPDGVGPVERLHFESLFAEQALGTALATVPVPAALPGGLVLMGVLGLRRRR